ncbi:ionotropic receptor 93a-like [Macrobrachium rosenbergii]|uniref:ionotropic receptor 93a-like n=1 Tax=Macrobrachium rosenbergii TaxID=79674 RepID=UPI0034D6C5D9
MQVISPTDDSLYIADNHNSHRSQLEKRADVYPSKQVMGVLRSFVLVILASSLEADKPAGFGKAISDILAIDRRPYCSVVVITSDSHYLFLDAVLKDIGKRDRLLGIFRLNNNGNYTEYPESDVQLQMDGVVSKARSLRLRSRCLLVVFLHDDERFLEIFAEGSLRGRLLVWASRLLVITRLSFLRLRSLLASYWTFSMMNAVMMNLEGNSTSLKLYTNLPYSSSGSQIVQVATWSQENGLSLRRKNNLFAEKFSNFFGATVNVTALPYAPHWLETVEEHPDGSTTKIYGGTDYQLLSTISEALNFTIRVLQTSSWDEVATRVEERVSFMATVFHNVLPQRLERYDYSYTYEYGSLDFCVAKPGLKPRWQALYYPLTDEVWLAILAALVLVPVVLCLVCVSSHTPTFQVKSGKALSLHAALENVFGTLLGQPLLKDLPDGSSSRTVLGTWLVFAFILGTAYRGNLTASLTIPKYPPRVETVEQLVETFDRITMPPFGNEFIQFFKQSDNKLYKNMAERMSIVPSVMDGLRQAIKEKEAHVAGRRFMEQTIAKYFSNPDGSTKLYVGRESILPGISAWPLPHDAPYRPQIDRLMMSVIEAGLYEHWSRTILRLAQGESRKRAREYREQQQKEKTKNSVSVNENEMDDPNEDDNQASRPSQALTVVHMQGPLMLLLLGLVAGGICFCLEVVARHLVSRG